MKVDSRKKNEGSVEECLKTAYRLLGYRQRSEIELRNKIGSRFTKAAIDTVIERLRDKHMVDDTAFAQYWRERRETLNPRSRRMVCIELRQKGIDKEVINKVLDSYNDEENAYRAAKKKANLLSKEGYANFRRKIGSFLMRRGFNYEVTNQTVDRLWRELS
ncbi:MAG: regulatory protein RecX [Dehalococcoidia bacterium]